MTVSSRLTRLLLNIIPIPSSTHAIRINSLLLSGENIHDFNIYLFAISDCISCTSALSVIYSYYPRAMVNHPFVSNLITSAKVMVVHQFHIVCIFYYFDLKFLFSNIERASDQFHLFLWYWSIFAV